MEFNPYLKPWLQPAPNHVAGKGQIETAQEAVNIRWQTRSAPPSEYEDRLGDALTKAFTDGALTLADVVQALNAQGVQTPHGQPWTEDSFTAEIARLGR
jgi:hypothetical protein